MKRVLDLNDDMSVADKSVEESESLQTLFVSSSEVSCGRLVVFCNLEFLEFFFLSRVLKLSEVENNSSQHQISEDFVIWANREDRVSQKYLISFL